MKRFLKNTFYIIIEIFKWPNILWHLLAILLTYFIVIMGIDWWYYVSTRFVSHYYWFPAAFVGGLLPVMVPLVLYFFGKLIKDLVIKNAGAALFQASLLGSVISSTYKAFTGRIPPKFGEISIDISNGFQFGFWENGIFSGWPSSHTTIAFAMAVCLIMLFPKSKTMRYGALIYATYIGFGASVGFHWFSEFVAGAIMGSLIGYVVGKRYKKAV